MLWRDFPKERWQKKRWFNNRYRLMRDYLLELCPYCYWCGCKVVYFKRPEVPLGTKEERLPDNFAIIDHLKSRYFRKKGEECEKVLACNACNNRRSHEEQYLNEDYKKSHF